MTELKHTTATYTSILESRFKKAFVHIDLGLTHALRKHFPSKHVLPTTHFPIDDYLAEIRNKPVEEIRHEWQGGLSWMRWSTPSYTSEGEIETDIECGHLQVTWEGTLFDVFKAQWENRSQIYWALVFDGHTDDAGRQFFRTVQLWDDKRLANSEWIWVFENGGWSRDQPLTRAIKDVAWDDLVLASGTLDRLKRDVDTFFKSKPIYKSLGVPWKRGLLLLGPPGNGKSHTLKILSKETKCSSLYVKGTTSSCAPSEWCVKLIFEQARRSAPCLLILEDLDSLLGPETRTVFLNEVDGFANNDGILILASSNHPERIDDAIINRPSRFDVKYTFDLPSIDLRRRYALKWLAKVAELDAEYRPPIQATEREKIADKIAEGTEGFSFAYLKELFLAFLLSYAHSGGAGTESEAQDLLFKHVEQLKEQVVNLKKEKKTEDAASE